jgi:anion-transporting  ArsA/GET3 family ATPase
LAIMLTPMRDLLDRQLLYVTGKGGVGKTTVALAAGLAAAARGHRTIIAEVGGQQRIPRLFGRTDARIGDEVPLRDGLFTMSIDPAVALEHFVAQQLRSRPLTQVLTRSNVFKTFVDAAPGAKELVTIGAVWDLVQDRRWHKALPTYDLVVVDAPASGHGVGMLRTPKTFGDIARVGPLAQQAYKIAEWLQDGRRAGYLAVALAQEMPVAETIELEHILRRTLGRPLEAVVVNQVLARRFNAAEVARVAGVADDRPVARGARAAVASYAERVRVQQGQLSRLRRGTDAAVGTLPFVIRPALELDDIEAFSGRVQDIVG